MGMRWGNSIKENGVTNPNPSRGAPIIFGFDEVFKWFKRFGSPRQPPRPEQHIIVSAGAYGGVLPRDFPTNVGNIFTELPVGNIPASGIAPRIAARPNSASMLDSAQFYTQIPGTGVLLGMATKAFARQTEDVHPAAVTDVTHVRNVHPTTSRKVLQGGRAL